MINTLNYWKICIIAHPDGKTTLSIAGRRAKQLCFEVYFFKKFNFLEYNVVFHDRLNRFGSVKIRRSPLKRGTP
jgi:hypothetical protein